MPERESTPVRSGNARNRRPTEAGSLPAVVLRQIRVHSFPRSIRRERV